MKNYYAAYKRYKNPKTGLVDSADGVIYLEPHDHKALKGKEFTSSNEAIQAVKDHNTKNRDAAKLAAAVELIQAGEHEAALELISSAETQSGVEMVLLNVIEF